MNYPRRHVLFALPLIVVVFVLSLAIPHQMGAAPVADFAAPMSLQEAQARVSLAQQADTQRRDAIARTLGATSAASLPTVQNLFFSETNHHLSDRAGFLKYWRENGETHKHGYYESTWGAINAALNSTGQLASPPAALVTGEYPYNSAPLPQGV